MGGGRKGVAKGGAALEKFRCRSCVELGLYVVFESPSLFLRGGISELFMQRAQFAPPGEERRIPPHKHMHGLWAARCLQVAPMRDGKRHFSIKPYLSCLLHSCYMYIFMCIFMYLQRFLCSRPLLCASSPVAVLLANNIISHVWRVLLTWHGLQVISFFLLNVRAHISEWRAPVLFTFHSPLLDPSTLKPNICQWIISVQSSICSTQRLMSRRRHT